MGIDAEIAAMIAKHFDAAETVYVMPGPGGCQGMACGFQSKNETLPADEEMNEVYIEEPYYGFPIQ